MHNTLAFESSVSAGGDVSTQEPSAFRDQFHKFAGYYLIPHELLHILAYLITGKPYRYDWGAHRIRSLSPKTRGQKLFVLLFPFGVCWGIGLFFGLLWLLSAFFIQLPPERYFIDGPTWHLVLLVLAWLSVFYSSTALQDLIDAYGWLFKYQAQNDSPQPQQDPHEH